MKKLAWVLVIIGLIGGANHLWGKYREHNTRVTVDNRPAVQAIRGVLSAGDGYILALTAQGEMYGWGSNVDMQLGLTNTESAPVPKQVVPNQTWRYVDADRSASYAIGNDGLGWQRSYARGLQSHDPNVRAKYATYRLLDPGMHWRLIKASTGNTAGIDTSGRLWLWREGKAKYSALDPQLDGPLYDFVEASPKNRWLDVCINYTALYAIAEDGSLWKHANVAANPKQAAQTTDDAATFTLTKQTTTTSFRRVICRENSSHVLAIDQHDQLWGFGANTFGELGDGDGDGFTPNVAVPEDNMKPLTDKRWADIAIGPGFTLGIAIDGSLWGWGNNIGGKLGTGNEDYRDIPTLVDNSRTWIAVTASYISGAGLTKNGEIYSWGDNHAGILGEGGAAQRRYVPTLVYGTQGWGVNIEERDKK